MSEHDVAADGGLLARRLREDEPLVAVELRPPRTGLSRGDTMDVWIDLYHSIQHLARQDRFVFLTDNAVGASEEENLRHLSANLGPDVDPRRLIPFLTCKHRLDYCFLYSNRAARQGIESLTVVGGDRASGPPRCVPLSKELRALVADREASLSLGGWVNPHRDPAGQARMVAAHDFAAEYYLTQIVSHHQMEVVDGFMAEAGRLGITTPGAFGVFFYRSPNLETLQRLSAFIPVPVEELTREFEQGVTAEEICARTIVALRRAGARHVYICNLGMHRVEARLGSVLSKVGELEP